MRVSPAGRGNRHRHQGRARSGQRRRHRGGPGGTQLLERHLELPLDHERVAGGVALALNVDVVVPFIERVLGTELMSKEVYYISALPSELQWGDVITITLVSFVLSLVATLYPSWRASRINPAEALRYE